MIKPVTNTQSYTCLSCSQKSQSVVECRFPQTSDVAEIIAVYPQISLISCEASSGRVNYSGKIVFTVAYADEEGKLCRMQKGAEFSHYADDETIAPAQIAQCSLCCEKLQVKRDGSSFVLSAIVGAEIEVYARREREFIVDCEGAFVNKSSATFYSAVTFSGESEVEDDFDADSVVDVLIPGAQPIVLSAECGTGEITVEGEIYLSLFAMRQTMPVCMDRVIPFKAVIPCDDSSIGRKARVKAEIKDLNVTATVNEERGKCEINFVGSLAFSGVFYDLQEEEAVLDAFCPDKELKLASAKEICSPCVYSETFSERVSGGAVSKAKLDFSCLLRAAALPRAEYSFVEESGAVEGGIFAELIYEQNGEIKSTEINLPFSVKLKSEVKEGQSVIIDAAVCGMNVKQRTEGEIDAEAVIKISASIVEKRECAYICGAEEGEAVPVNDSAISVYIPEAGDGLWELSKKLMQSPQTIADCNPDLNYPLTGKERILVYRSKK